MEKRTGIYICTGCEIGWSIDVDNICKSYAASTGIVFCKSHSALCSVEGSGLIAEDIERESLDSIVIAACSSRYKTDVFSFGENIMVERVNLREQVVWCGQPNHEDTQMAAEDYIRMGIAAVQNIAIPRPYIAENISEEILVVGGGITGITAALEGAAAGYTVHIVEKEAEPGGYAKKLYKQMPSKAPFDVLAEPVINEKIREAENNPLIKLYKSTTIDRIEGQPGKFSVQLSNRVSHEEDSALRDNGVTFSTKPGNEGNHALSVGAIVSAMGWKPYDPSGLTHLGYGKFENVVTGPQFEDIVKNSPETILKKDVLFIQCAGSRDNNHLPYCSSVCCGVSLKQAKYVIEKDRNSLAYIIYKDIRTPGMAEEFYREVQKEDRILLTKGEVEDVDKLNGRLRVNIKDTLLGEDISILVDMVVLATGMVPSDTKELSMSYRQGKGLPELKYNFPDSHFICFPYETRRTGIYAAGTIRAPMDIPSCMEDAAGAMLKAIQCIESVKRGESVHPRSGDMSYPELYMERCTDCKRCTEECPVGAYDETEKGTPLPNPNRCRRCGICLGSCPERVINFSNFSIHSISSVIKSVYIPDEFEEKPRVLVFVCENDAYPAFDMAGRKRLKYSPFVRIIPVRCLGSINKVWISDALSKGFDGILQIGCKPGENYQCHFIHGSELTETRGENIQETLQTMMLEPERIRTEFVEITDYDKIPDIINSYMETIEAIGPNPFKGM
ncbi:MAG: hydrogenase iron-sulfur subunit [Bacteroidales bacterium]|nr:hydrogenase iron-sulfur subunit [Bacteroidales bacterium]